MEITRQSLTVSVELPIQFSSLRNGNDSTIYNVTVAGLSSLFDLMPESVKARVTEAIAMQLRGIK
jgi:hypothetical protein